MENQLILLNPKNQKGELLIFVPGWACDWTLTKSDLLALEPPILVIDQPNPWTLSPLLISFLRDFPVKKIRLWGFSMGATWAWEFARQFPNLIQELVVIGLRPHYPNCPQIATYLKKNRSAYLKKFYQASFQDTHENDLFFSSFWNHHSQKNTLDYLLSTLDYLEKTHLIALNNPSFPTTVIHGTKDQIAPIKEARMLNDATLNSLFFPLDTGHIPFLSPEWPLFLKKFRI